MVGCGSAVLVIGVTIWALAFAVASRPDRFRPVHAAVFDSLEAEVEQTFGDSVTPVQRRLFEGSYERFRSAWVAGKIPPSAARECRRRLFQELRKQTLDEDDVRSLREFFDRLVSPRASQAA
jgi:hypothetical protein